MNATSNETVVNKYRIVAGVSFDETGDNALREAARIALHRDDVELHVVHAIPGAPSGGAASLEKTNDALSMVPVRLRANIAMLRERGLDRLPHEIVVHVRVGTPAEAIHQLAGVVDADLIVVGTHGRRGLQRAVLGSVAETLVRTAHCSVVVAHAKNYEGMTRTVAPEPVCPECAVTRKQTHGATTWCEYHSRPQFRPHAYSYRETFSLSPHDPGIVPSGS